MIYAKKELDSNGDFCDSEGFRWAIFTCRRIRTHKGINVGWTAFDSFEECLAAWGLHSGIDMGEPLALPTRPTS